jgi:hypothetical protein
MRAVVTQLIELAPGVRNQATGSAQSDPVQGPGQGVDYSVNGGSTEYNNWEIDGGDVLDSGSMSNLNVSTGIYLKLRRPIRPQRLGRH